jgi:hypothetical protein
VTGAERTDPEPDPGNPTGVHSIGDDEQLAEDFGQPVAPGRAGGGNEALTPPLQDVSTALTALSSVADSRSMTETTKWSKTSATDARRQTTLRTWVWIPAISRLRAPPPTCRSRRSRAAHGH